MDSSLYRIATHLKELVKFLHHGNEISAKLSAQEAKTLLQSFGKTKLFSTLHLNLLFKDIIQFMSTDEDSIRVFQAKCMSLVKDVLIQHPLLQCELCKLLRWSFSFY